MEQVYLCGLPKYHGIGPRIEYIPNAIGTSESFWGAGGVRQEIWITAGEFVDDLLVAVDDLQ